MVLDMGGNTDRMVFIEINFYITVYFETIHT